LPYFSDHRILLGAGQHGDVVALDGGRQQADDSRRAAHRIRSPGTRHYPEPKILKKIIILTKKCFITNLAFYLTHPPFDVRDFV
jgi:hypothetical protein